MSFVLYATTCYMKKERHHLCIYVENDSANAQPTTESTESASVETAIIPSLTRIKLEVVTGKKSTNTPKIITLNQLLNVQRTKAQSGRSKRNLYVSTDVIGISGMATTPTSEQSKQASSTTLSTTSSEVLLAQTPISPRSFSFGRFFRSQSSTDVAANTVSTSIVQITYVDVSSTIRWSVRRLVLEVESEEGANELCANLNRCLSTLKQRPRRLLAFVNPFGGKEHSVFTTDNWYYEVVFATVSRCTRSRAPFVFEKKVLPIFTEANIAVNSIVTERANHARDYVLNEDLSSYDGLICVGGDGMFAELCHGLLLRTSREAQLDIDDRQVKIVRPELRIGIIPAGSTDAVVFGTTGLNDPVTSALQIIVGESLSIDIATVHNEKGFVRFLATMLSYGFFGDIIHQSDKWRCLGPLRYELAGFCQFILNRSYHTALTITLSPLDFSQLSQEETQTAMNNTIDGATSYSTSATENKQVDDDSERINRSIIAPGLAFCRRNCETCAVIEKNDVDTVRSPVQIQRQGRYTTINCLNMPCRCAKSKFGMSPFVHLGDGTFDLILVKRSWQTGFLRFLWQVANDSRTIEDLPNVERYRVSEVLIQPMHTDHIRLGNWACDGELISGTEIKIRIHRQALNLFASGIQFDHVGRNNPMKKSATIAT